MSEILKVILVVIVLPFGFSLIYNGIVECYVHNNIFGIFLLSIPLPIIGTFIGCIIIYKKQNLEFKFWKSLWNKIKKIFTFKMYFKRKSKQNNILSQS